ncbi:MAG: hypothetical protein E7500_06095 [Ruminococcus sp.]|nr:hypothetical protein [Ruminococcus sp.]
MQNKEKLIFAHRGLFDDEMIPENSLSAFQRAIDAGLGIELDVRLTKDGVPVVFHDKTLRRMCSDTRKISKITYDELKKLRLKGSDEGIPTLEQTLELIGGQVPLLVETKLPKRRTLSRRLERRIIPLLRDYKGDFSLQSFNKGSVRFLKRHMPQVKCGILSGSLYPEPSGFDFISYKLAGMTEKKAQELKKRYEQVFGWSVVPLSDEEKRYALSTLDLDGIII